jgi:hypothetical protein
MGVTPETARSYHRETVILPDGRRIAGWPPGAASGQLLEHRLRDNLATQLGGITEAQLPYGRADVLTKDTVFEVEPAENWRHGVRQVLAYAAQVGLPPAVAQADRTAALEAANAELRTELDGTRSDLDAALAEAEQLASAACKHPAGAVDGTTCARSGERAHPRDPPSAQPASLTSHGDPPPPGASA